MLYEVSQTLILAIKTKILVLMICAESVLNRTQFTIVQLPNIVSNE